MITDLSRHTRATVCLRAGLAAARAAREEQDTTVRAALFRIARTYGRHGRRILKNR